ncbi:MAG: argininosuccinate lyase, partial [Hyphomonadaceae bacterium]|nr:argininosuccinate lyase [Hyphomonadaceae bacterium]
LTLMKALPLAYAKDMQDDKAALFEGMDALMLSLAAMRAMVLDLSFSPVRMAAMAGAGYADATDLADWLVRALDLPFRQAHHVAGAIVREAEAQGLDLSQLPLSAMQAVEPRITQAVFDVLGPERSTASRTSYGGTAPVRVREQIARWRAALAQRQVMEDA